MAKPKARWNRAAGRQGHARPSRVAACQSLTGRIASNPAVWSGDTCIRGTRIPVHIVLDLLAADESVENILAAHPNVTRDDVCAGIDHE